MFADIITVMDLNGFVSYLLIQGQKGEPGDVPIVSVGLI